jgi:hypothetical protein
MRINFFDKKVCTQFAYFIGVVSTALTCVSFFYNIGDIAAHYYSRNVGFIIFLVLLLLSYSGIFYWYKTKKSVIFMLDQTKFTIKIGDIFDQDGLKVIAFNEYFDTKVDDIIIAKSSLNGKYILRNEPDISELDTAIEQDTKLQEKIVLEGVKRNGKSTKYKLGSIVVRNDYLLVAFSKFDEDNRANLNYEEYAKCLLQFWKEIDRVYAGKKVIIPLMGNGITRIEKHTNITTQELYETILRTFLLSRIRLKNDAELILVVTSRDFHSIYPYTG